MVSLRGYNLATDNAIELRNVSISYTVDMEKTEKGLFKKNKRKHVVLDNIDLNVKKGEILGIIGSNGAGKSTLLSIIARIQQPDQGDVTINGKVATILELGMGFHQDLTGRENIVLKGELYGFSKKWIESRMDQIIDYSGIRNYIDNPVRTYSSGMRSRLAFSIMINVDADIMLVDEILSTGDATFSAKAADYFKKILKDGKTVVYVSHSSGSVESLCTRVIWLDNGKIIADGKPKKICAMYNEATMNSLEVVQDHAQTGLAEAQYRLGLFYKEGNGVEKSESLYLYWIQMAAEQGHIRAQVEMADLLINSDEEGDRSKAILYYQSSASKGDSEARIKLATILGKGEVRHEYERVKQIFKKIVEGGNPSVIYKYAIFLLKTSWDEADYQESFFWLKKLSDEYQHPDALIQLAIMYRDGIGTKRDLDLFVKTLEFAHSIGIVPASNMLADLYYNGRIIDENPEKALGLYEYCAERGVTSCQYIVANIYQEGKGVIQNTEKAQYWYNMYSKSQLLSYQLSIIDIISSGRNNYSAPLSGIYDDISDSKDPRALIEMGNLVSNQSGFGVKIDKEHFSDILDKLSESYGRGMSFAYQYYSDVMYEGYDSAKAKDLLKKLRYTGNPEYQFKYAIDLIDSEKQIGEEAIKYLRLAVEGNYKDALIFCEEHGIKLEKNA